jgi:hypothetical protein
MTCKQCGAPCPQASGYCTYCGSSIPRPELVTITLGEAIQNLLTSTLPIEYCIKCGKLNEGRTEFCIWCGFDRTLPYCTNCCKRFDSRAERFCSRCKWYKHEQWVDESGSNAEQFSDGTVVFGRLDGSTCWQYIDGTVTLQESDGSVTTRDKKKGKITRCPNRVRSPQFIPYFTDGEIFFNNHLLSSREQMARDSVPGRPPGSVLPAPVPPASARFPKYR